MNTLLQDLRYGVRTLSRTPGVVVVAILALALGIGANTAIFSVINAAVLSPLPFDESEKLFMIWETSEDEPNAKGSSSYPNTADYRAQNQVFEEVAAFRPSGFNLTGMGDAERVEGGRVGAGFFTVLRINAVLGRTFTEEEDKAGAPRVVVLGHGLWQRRFGSDPNILGQTITLSGNLHTVIGVLPSGFRFPIELSEAELWTTTAHDGGNLTERGAHTNDVIARLKPGITPEQAQADLSAIAARLAEQYPNSNTGLGVRLVQAQEELVGDIKPALWILFGAVGFVLLIACSNVANLLLARATSRHKEMAVRTALGASRWRVVRQLLTESSLLALTGGAAGLLVALWGIEALVRLIPDEFSSVRDIQIDTRVMIFTLAISVITGIVFGLAPALRASRTDLNETLKEGGRSNSASASRRALRNLLVISEVALALMLLVGAGLFMKSFFRLTNVDPGFEPKNVLTMRINIGGPKYRDTQQRVLLIEQAIEKLKAIPGIESAAFITPLPFSGDSVASSFQIKGRPAPPPGQEFDAANLGTTPDYFRTMKIPLISGRHFTSQDVIGKRGVVIVNEAFVSRYFPDEDPLGKQIHSIGIGFDDNDPVEWDIVGVVGNIKHRSLETPARPEIYAPHRQHPWGWGYFVIRTTVDPANLTSAVRDEVQSIDRDQPVYLIRTLSSLISNSLAKPRFYALLLSIFAAVGLLLTMVGVYGVISYSVSERTREIGVRVALGATWGQISKMILSQGMSVTFIGIVIGLVGAYAISRVVESLLFEVSATDTLIFVVVPILLAAVSAVACLVPARRAAKVDPMVALREE